MKLDPRERLIVALDVPSVGEAEALVNGGIADILVSNQVVGDAKLARTAALADQGARIALCFDDPAQVRANIPKRDNVWDDDYVGILFDTFNDQRRAYEFDFNPLGVQADGDGDRADQGGQQGEGAVGDQHPGQHADEREPAQPGLAGQPLAVTRRFMTRTRSGHGSSDPATTDARSGFCENAGNQSLPGRSCEPSHAMVPGLG